MAEMNSTINFIWMIFKISTKKKKNPEKVNRAILIYAHTEIKSTMFLKIKSKKSARSNIIQ